MLSLCCVCVWGGALDQWEGGAIESAGGYDKVFDNFKNLN